MTGLTCIKDIYNKILHLFKRGVISKVSNDRDVYQTAQVSYLGKTADTEILYPYGLCGNPPRGSLALIMNVQGHEDNRTAICNYPGARFKNLTEGEIALGNYMTKSHVKFNSNGDITIECNNNMTVTVSKDDNVTINGNATVNITGTAQVTAASVTVAAPVTVNGDVTINGNLSVDGTSTSSGSMSAPEFTAGSINLTTHVHGGVQSGGSNTSGPQ